MSTESLFVRLCRLPEEQRNAILARYSTFELALLSHAWRGFRARPNQVLPANDPWSEAVLCGGRGSGKTKAAAEWLREEVEEGRARTIALIAPDKGEGRSKMLEGESGLLAAATPWFYPRWFPGRTPPEIEWRKRGELVAKAEMYSAEDRDFRGGNFDHAWGDEVSTWKWRRDLWTNVKLSLRVQRPGLVQPRGLLTFSPTPDDFFREFRDKAKDPNNGILFFQWSSWENRWHLAPSYAKTLASLEGRLGLQERDGIILDELKGTLFPQATIDQHRIGPDQLPQRFIHIVVSIDPADSVSNRSDETGIVVDALDARHHVYVLDDKTGKHTPKQWAAIALEAHRKWARHADKIEIIAETNRGGDNVRSNIQLYEETEHLRAGKTTPFKPTEVVRIRASESKEARAQPVAQAYDQGRIHHFGHLARLEAEMSGWIPGITKKSPNGLDAHVHAVHRLILDEPAENNEELLRGVGERRVAVATPEDAAALKHLDALFGPREAWRRTL
ncbi:MAG: DNA-packaging protein [Polyangiaceae bacterium]|nr:DNA-packaging protein [Polyangiaceae bacterium]